MQKKITHIQTQLENAKSDAKDKLEKIKEKQAKAAVQKPEKKPPSAKKSATEEDDIHDASEKTRKDIWRRQPVSCQSPPHDTNANEIITIHRSSII